MPKVPASAADRLRANAGLKVWLAVALGTLVCAPYFTLQRAVEGSAYVMPASPLDRLVPENEAWIWVYVTLYAFMLVPPLLSRSRTALVRYAVGFVGVCV